MAFIIVIEGTDGSGKQTQTAKLFEYIKSRIDESKHKLITQSFPNYESQSSGPVKMYLGGELGANVKSMDAYQASVLFSIDRLCTMKRLAEYVEDENAIIILDRYVESNMLHQAGKIADFEKAKKFIKWLEDFEFGILALPKPDKIIFLDMPVEVSQRLANERKDLKSGKSKDIHESDINHLRDAYETGKKVANLFDWEVVRCVDDNNNIRTIDDIHGEVVLKSNIDEILKKYN